MKITLTASFERDYQHHNLKEKELVHEVITKLPQQMGKPHSHSGIGIRKIHASGIYEARLGLGLRMVFALGKGELILHRLGDHETVRKYLKNL